MLDLTLSSLSSAALLGGLLCLAACGTKDDATDGESTNDPVTTAGSTTGGATESPTSTGTTADPDTSTTQGTDAETETAGACAGHDEVDACCCFSELKPGLGPTPPVIEIGCGDSPLCPTFEVLCGDPEDFMSGSPCASTSDDAALDCALAALAGGEPGSLQIDLRNPGGGGFWGETLRYYIRGDGTAFRYEDGYSDSSNSAEIELRALQPAAFFTDCQAADTVEARITCLLDAATDEVVELCYETN